MQIIKKNVLREKYNSMKNEELCKELGISYPTLMRIIDKAGIKRKGSGNPYHREKIRVVG